MSECCKKWSNWLIDAPNPHPARKCNFCPDCGASLSTKPKREINGFADVTNIISDSMGRLTEAIRELKETIGGK